VEPTAQDWRTWKKAIKHLHSQSPGPTWGYTHQIWREDVSPGKPNITTAFKILPKDTLDTIITNLPPYQTHILGEYNINQFLIEDLKAYSQLSLTAGSDGGSRERSASHAYTIKYNMETIIVGHGPVDGYPVTSFRAELFGLWGVLKMMSILLKLLPTATIDLEILCDNKAVVTLVGELGQGRDLPVLAPEYDILSEIRQLQNQIVSQQTITYTWVRGHQDPALGEAEAINNEMDQLCNDYMDSHQTAPTTPFMPCSDVCIQLEGG
jgi:hypothetical protein